MLLSTKNHITTSCVISQHRVCKNGETLFKGVQTDVHTFLPAIYQHFQFSYTRFYKMDHLSKLGWLASEILMKDSFSRDNYQSWQVGMVIANANASLDSDLKYILSVSDIPSPALFVYTLPNIMVGEICIRNHFTGEAAFFISPGFDAAFMEVYVDNLLNNMSLSACICGWVDLIDEEYKAVLFLVEKGCSEGEIPFDKQQMNKIFDNDN